jgi:hypothetical protein
MTWPQRYLWRQLDSEWFVIEDVQRGRAEVLRGRNGTTVAWACDLMNAAVA